MIYTINTNECTFCGLCAAECPADVITIEKNSKKAEIDNGNCIKCSHCGMVCPVNAVRVDGAKLPEHPESTAESSLTNFDHIINSKRSIRQYKSEQLESAALSAILHAGRTTATATNSQQVKAIILQDEAVKNTSILISKVLLKVVNFGLNPAGRILLKLFGLGRYGRRELLEDYHSRITETLAGHSDIFFFNAPTVVILTYPASGRRFGRTDCALAGQNMMLAAHARGIGSCMIGFAEAALMTKKLRKKIGVTPDRRIGLIFTLGYQKAKYYRYPVRKEWEV